MHVFYLEKNQRVFLISPAKNEKKTALNAKASGR
jgi:hypothetical protein